MLELATCPHCQMLLPEDAINQGVLKACPSCGVQVGIELYPAAFKPQRLGQAGEAILVEGEASCFYHPQKRAAIPCAWCGRFLCALCDVELKGEHICPVCLEGGRRKGKLTDLENRRTLYDTLALHLSLFPFLITGPAAIGVALYAWKKPTSILRRSRLRLYLAVFLGLAQTAGWIILMMQDS